MRRVVRAVILGAASIAGSGLVAIATVDFGEATSLTSKNLAFLGFNVQPVWLKATAADGWFIAAGFLVIVACAIILLWTEQDPEKARRAHFVSNLQKLLTWTVSLKQRMVASATDAEFLALKLELEKLRNEATRWIQGDMGEAAFAKYVSGSITMIDMIWSGEHDPIVHLERVKAIQHLELRRSNIEELMRDDYFDPPYPTLFERIKKWIQDRK